MINIQMCKMHAVFINKFKSQIKLYLLKLPDRTLSPSSCISGTACLTICEISLFVTEGNREGILLATQRVWGRSLRGSGGKSALDIH